MTRALDNQLAAIEAEMRRLKAELGNFPVRWASGGGSQAVDRKELGQFDGGDVQAGETAEFTIYYWNKSTTPATWTATTDTIPNVRNTTGVVIQQGKKAVAEWFRRSREYEASPLEC